MSRSFLRSLLAFSSTRTLHLDGGSDILAGAARGGDGLGAHRSEGRAAHRVGIGANSEGEDNGRDLHGDRSVATAAATAAFLFGGESSGNENTSLVCPLAVDRELQGQFGREKG